MNQLPAPASGSASAGDTLNGASGGSTTGLADTSSTNMAQTSSSWGFSIGLGGSSGIGAVLNASNGLSTDLTGAVNAGNARVSALYGIAAARQAYNLGNAIIGTDGIANLSLEDIKNTTSITIGFNASKSSTSESTDSTHYVQSLLSAGNVANINVTGDATLNGGAISANTVNLAVGGNLVITSTQDSETQSYHSTSSSLGASLGINLDGGVTGTLSVSASKANGTADWQSVTQASGIYAGTGGYHVKVGGGLTMASGVLGSTTADGNSLFVAGPITLKTLTNINNQSIQSESYGITFSTDPKQMLMGAANASTGALASALGGGQNRSQSSFTPNIITGCPGGVSVSCTTVTYGDTAQGAIANPGTNLATTIQTQQQSAAALNAASAAVATTLGDLFGNKGDSGTGLAIKSLLHGATQAGLGALAGESSSGILASGLAGAAADPLGVVATNALCGTGTSCQQTQIQDYVACQTSQGTNCDAYNNDMAVIKGEIDATVSMAGILIGGVAGDVHAGEAAANSVVVNNKIDHINTVSCTSTDKCATSWDLFWSSDTGQELLLIGQSVGEDKAYIEGCITTKAALTGDCITINSRYQNWLSIRNSLYTSPITNQIAFLIPSDFADTRVLEPLPATVGGAGVAAADVGTEVATATESTVASVGIWAGILRALNPVAILSLLFYSERMGDGTIKNNIEPLSIPPGNRVQIGLTKDGVQIFKDEFGNFYSFDYAGKRIDWGSILPESGLSPKYTVNADGSIVGPQGGVYYPTEFTLNGAIAYYANGAYYTVVNGSMNYIYAQVGGLIFENQVLSSSGVTKNTQTFMPPVPEGTDPNDSSTKPSGVIPDGFADGSNPFLQGLVEVKFYNATTLDVSYQIETEYLVAYELGMKYTIVVAPDTVISTELKDFIEKRK